MDVLWDVILCPELVQLVGKAQLLLDAAFKRMLAIHERGAGEAKEDVDVVSRGGVADHGVQMLWGVRRG